MTNLDTIFKAYDIRGIVDETLNLEIVTAVGAAFVTAMKLEGQKIVIGYDMRPSSAEFSEAFAAGAHKAGISEIQIIGLISTDGLYYASGIYDSPAVMFTASHNPAEYNGMKLCLGSALGISKETGLDKIKGCTDKYLSKGLPDKANTNFSKHYTPVIEDYVDGLRSAVPIEGRKKIKIVVDAANGMGGHIVPPVFAATKNHPELPFLITPMFFELDGTFPNHPADPLNPENLKPLQAKVKELKADVGLAFDGDADRCFIIDENGNPVPPSTVAAIITKRLLKTMPSSTILYSKTTSKVLKETIESYGGEPYLIKVGHSTAKQKMKETGAVFGAEHSAHYYFKNFYGADSGMLAALYILAELDETGSTMSELAKDFNPYYSSGEINIKVESINNVMSELIKNYSETYKWDDFDGLFFEKQLTPETWVWFNVRPSNTEPYIRVNVESNSKNLMRHITAEVTKIVKLA
jgi:phosphomannomutase